jgi:3-phosphoshikimate 1-carboxyvinyltransferase
LKGAEIESHGDHRIAMAFAVAGLLAQGTTVIRGSNCVDISFPGFFDVLARVVE